MKKFESYYIDIDKFVFEGFGLGKLSKTLQEVPAEEESLKIFVRFAYPGDTVKARVTKLKKNYAEADLEEVIVASPHRVDAPCKYFMSCGGCKQQDLDYQQQIAYKQMQIDELFFPLNDLHNFIREDIVPCNNIFHYRNKMEFSFAERRWVPFSQLATHAEERKLPALGFHPPNGFNQVIQIDDCKLHPEPGNIILRTTSNFFFTRNFSIYNNKSESGYLRNLVVRQAGTTGEIMVNLVTSERDEALMKEFTNAILTAVPEVTTVINNVNTKKAMTATGEVEYIDYGTGFIIDQIGKLKFRISANSFFQTNTRQGETLYQTAVDFAEFTGNEIVYDLYCGAGTIALFIAEFVKEVYGLELIASAVRDANANKELNHTVNVKFFSSDLYKSFIPLIEENSIPKPDIIIVDPPRNGMHKNTIEDIIKLSPAKIIYVSCNPATQVRDIRLMETAYRLVKIKPVDMFPHTYHIENVALLERRQ